MAPGGYRRCAAFQCHHSCWSGYNPNRATGHVATPGAPCSCYFVCFVLFVVCVCVFLFFLSNNIARANQYRSSPEPKRLQMEHADAVTTLRVPTKFFRLFDYTLCFAELFPPMGHQLPLILASLQTLRSCCHPKGTNDPLISLLPIMGSPALCAPSIAPACMYSARTRSLLGSCARHKHASAIHSTEGSSDAHTQAHNGNQLNLMYCKNIAIH